MVALSLQAEPCVSRVRQGPFDAGTVKAPAKVQYAWEQWPQCSLYNGNGGCDDHEGIAATPFCWDGAKSCAV
jgi:hypothetical protein